MSLSSYGNKCSLGLVQFIPQKRRKHLLMTFSFNAYIIMLYCMLYLKRYTYIPIVYAKLLKLLNSNRMLCILSMVPSCFIFQTIIRIRMLFTHVTNNIFNYINRFYSSCIQIFIPSFIVSLQIRQFIVKQQQQQPVTCTNAYMVRVNISPQYVGTIYKHTSLHKSIHFIDKTIA